MKPINERRIRQAKRLLREVYSMIPKFECVDGCTECCGATLWTYIEWKLISDWLKERGREERFAKDIFEKCPYIENGKCSIYEVRPLVCRLFGVTKRLKCPYREPEFYLPDEFADKLVEAVKRILIDLLEYRKVTDETKRFVAELKQEYLSISKQQSICTNIS